MRLKKIVACFAFSFLMASATFAQEPASHSQQIPLHLDSNPYPIDPRKPCNICSRPNDCKANPILNLPGLRGRPHIDQGLGGCTCGKKCADHHPMKSWNWPQPFSALRECNHPQFAAWLENPCRKRLTNVYDRLEDFRLIQYQRTDNGFTGIGRDPYGCLGESRQLQSNVRGLQFRQPGEPVFGSPSLSQNDNWPTQTRQPLQPRSNQQVRMAPQQQRLPGPSERVSQQRGYDLEAFRKR